MELIEFMLLIFFFNIIQMRAERFEAAEQEIAAFNQGSEDFKVFYHTQRKRQEQSRCSFTKLIGYAFIGLVIFSFYRVHTIDRPKHVLINGPVEHENKVQVEEETKVETNRQSNVRTPKIFWLLTHKELEGLRMTEALVANHLIHVGKKSGFEVRVVNSFTAYDWLSPEMIEIVRKTKQTSKYIIQVHQLLRIALLIEHGGLSLQIPRYFLTHDLSWITDMLEQKLEDLIKNQEAQHIQYCKSNKEPEVMLFYQKRRDAKIYQSWFIYARKNSVLLKQTFTEMCKILIDGTWQLSYLSNSEQMEYEVLVKYFNNLFIEIINFRQRFWYTGDLFCETYHVLSFDKINGPFFTKVDDYKKVIDGFRIQKKQFYEKYGRKYILETDPNNLSGQFIKVLRFEDFGFAHKNSIIRSDFIEVEGNQWMSIPLKKERDISFCIISLKPLNLYNYEASINESIKHLNQQTFKNWHALYFVTELTQVSLALPFASVTVINASQYEGLNLQRAATKYCKKDDLGILLNYDETLGRETNLHNISLQMRDKSTYGAVLSVKHNDNIIKPRYLHNKVRRKVREPNLAMLQQVAHNFRVFSMYAYKSIPHMALHDNDGRYYDYQIPFLTLLEMGWDYKRCDNSDMIYHTKKIEHNIEIPKHRIVLPEIFVKMPFLKQIDVKKPQYFTKYAAVTLCGTMYLYLDRKARSLQHFFVLNNGSQFAGFQDRKQWPKLIENKIHQIWVGGQMPNYKKFLTSKIKQNHPNFEYYLWTNDNITRENFPVSYELIQHFLKYSQNSKYKKFASISDLMRTEIIFNHGGIYIDTNYLVFKKNALDDWLTFKGVFNTQIFPYHRFQREQTVFAAMKGFDRLKRLVDHRAISTRNIYAKYINIETGPTFFTATVLGDQQLDPDIFQPSFEYIFPQYPWDDSNNRNLCEADDKTKIEDILFKNKLTYRKDCGELYPFSIGTDFWQQGKSWG